MRTMVSYIMRRQFRAILITLAVITAFDLIVDFIGEIEKVGGDYTMFDAIVYSILLLPYRMSELAPAAALIGAILSLGGLAESFELTALRTVGYSKNDLAKPVLFTGAALAVLVLINTEIVAPASARLAGDIKGEVATESLQPGSRVWMRDRDRFVTAVPVGGTSFHDVVIFTHKDSRLRSVTRAESMRVVNGYMELDKVRESVFEDESVHKSEQDSKRVPFSSLALRARVSPDPKTMTALELIEYIQFLHTGYLNSDEYELELWAHLGHPLSVIVLLVLALPFALVLKPRASIGQRLFLGIMLGLACFIFNKTLSSFALIQNMPAWFATFLPLTLFFLFGVWRFRLCR